MSHTTLFPYPTSSPNRSNRPFSLPRIAPHSPFTLNAPSNEHNTDFLYSPFSGRSFETEGEGAVEVEGVGSPRVAHIASRSCADLIRLDMDLSDRRKGGEETSRGGGRTCADREKQGERVVTREGRYNNRPDTPVDDFLDIDKLSTTTPASHLALHSITASSSPTSRLSEATSPISTFYPSSSGFQSPFMPITPVTGQTSVSSSPLSSPTKYQPPKGPTLHKGSGSGSKGYDGISRAHAATNQVPVEPQRSPTQPLVVNRSPNRYTRPISSIYSNLIAPLDNNNSQTAPPHNQDFSSNRLSERFSTVTSTFSGFGPTMSEMMRNDTKGSPPDPPIRNSSGTFGSVTSESRPRRWSITSGESNDQLLQSPFTTPRTGEVKSEEREDLHDDATISSASAERRRKAMSMTMSDFSVDQSVDSSDLRQHYGKGSLMPSLAHHKRKSQDPKYHYRPLTDAERDALKKPIPMRQESAPLRLAPAINLAPPSYGTPLKGGYIKEESNIGDESSEGEVEIKKERRKTYISKVEQVMGSGAEMARTSRHIGNKTMGETNDDTSRNLPVPHYRGHKSSASVPVLPTSTPETFRRPKTPVITPERDRERSNTMPLPTLNTYPYFGAPDPEPGTSPVNTSTRNNSETLMTPHYTRIHDHARTGSIDSIPSINPSLTDSINTLSRLLPHSPTARFTPTSPPIDKALPPIPRNLPLHQDLNLPHRSELSAEQRAVLVRRARKLEQLLGEPLGENQMAQLVIDPVTSGTSVTTRVSDTWPNSPVSGILELPEFAREDCVPRHYQEKVQGVQDSMRSVNRSGSLGRKARAVLGLDGDGVGDEGGDLRVFLTRQTRVVETTLPRRGASLEGGSSSLRSHGGRIGSPTGTVDSFWADDADDEMTRKGKRAQLAKLQRMLGGPVPSTYVTNKPISPPPPEAQPHVSNDMSFISFDEPGQNPLKWTSKLTSGFRRKTSMPDNYNQIDGARSNTSSPSPPHGLITPGQDSVNGKSGAGRKGKYAEGESWTYF